MAVELTTIRRPEQTRARYPDEQGYVERDGVRIFYEVYGAGEPTVLLLPTWSIIHSRHWKMQIPYLARHCRVVTFDGRGNGRSDRPQDERPTTSASSRPTRSRCWTRPATERAVLVALSLGGAARRCCSRPSTRSASTAPSSSARLSRLAASRSPSARCYAFDERARHRRGLGEVQPPLLAARLPRLPRVLLLADVHRAALDQADRGLRRLGARDDAETLDRARRTRGARRRSESRELARPRALPGARDPRRPTTRSPAAAAAIGARRGDRRRARHARGLGPRPARARPGQGQPAAARLRRARRARRARWVRGKSRRKRALYISSPIGLGHAQRDVAIADELRKLHPDLEIDWLAQHPVTRRARGARRAHPPGERAPGERVAATSRASRPSTTCTASRRSAGWTRSCSPTSWSSTTSSATSDYDLWIGDEAWELDYYLHENPEQKRAAYVWLTDFVGWLPMPDGGEREAFLTADYNAEMIEHIARYPRVRDRAIFVGNPDDIVPDAVRPRPAADPRLDRASTTTSPATSPASTRATSRPRGAAARARLPRRRAGLHRHRRRLGRRRRTCCGA